MKDRTSRRRHARTRRRLVKLLLVVGLVVALGLGLVIFRSGREADDRGDDYDRLRQAYDSERFDEVRLLALSYLESHGPHAVVLFMLGRTEIQLGHVEQGLRNVQAALELDSKLSPAALFLADRAYLRQDYPVALKFARQALEDSTQKTEGTARYIIGRVLARPETLDVTGAIRHLEASEAAGVPGRILPDLLLTLVPLLRIREAAAPAPVDDPPSVRALRRARDALGRLREKEAGNEGVRFRLAQCEYEAGSYAAALELLREPFSEPRWRSHVPLLRLKCDFKYGDEDPREASEGFLDGRPEPDQLIDAAAFYRSVGRNDLAARLLAGAQDLHPENDSILLDRVRIHLDGARFRVAEKLLRDALSAGRDDPQIVLLLADVLEGRPERAGEAESLLRERAALPAAPPIVLLRLAQTLLDTAPDHPDHRARMARAEELLAAAYAAASGNASTERFRQFLQAKLDLSKGFFEAAIATLEDLCLRQPDHLPARRLLLEANARMGRPDGAIAQVDILMRLGAATPELYLDRAEALLRAGRDPALARRDAQAALDLDGKNEAAHLLLARAHLAEDPPDFDAAEERLLLASDRPGKGLRAKLLLCRIHLVRGAREKALALAREVADEAPDGALELQATRLIAEIRNLDSPGEMTVGAKETFERFIEEHPEDEAAMLGYASMLLERGDRDAARMWAERAIEASEGSVPARLVLFDVCLEAPSPDEQDRVRAEQLLEEVERIAPGSPEVPYLRGRLSLHAGEIEAAVRLLTEAREVLPGNSAPAYYLGVAHHQAGALEDARRALEGALRLDPRDFRTRALLAEIAFRRGRSLLAGGAAADPDGARGEFRYALGRSPGHLPSLAYLVNTFFDPGGGADPLDIADARRRCNDLIRQLEALLTRKREARTVDHLARAYRLMGAICYAQKDWEGLVASCERCLDLTPDDPEALLRMGLALRAAGRMDDAAEILARVRAEDPESRPILTTLARVLLEAGRPAQAADHLAEWLAAHPDDTTVRVLSGRALGEAGRLDDARKALAAVVEKDPDHLEAVERLTDLLVVTGRSDEAESALTDLLSRTHRKGEVRFMLGRVLLLDRFDSPRGLDQLRQALATAMRDPQYRAGCTVLLLRALIAREDFVEGVEVGRSFSAWQRKLRSYPVRFAITGLSAEAYCLFGVALERTGRRDLAEQAYREALALRPAFAQTLNNLANLLAVASLSGEEVPTEEMLACARAAVAADPKEPGFQDTLGMALRCVEQPAEAVVAFERAERLFRLRLGQQERTARSARMEKRLGRTLLNLALAHLEADRPNLAKATLARAVEAHPGIGETLGFKEAAALIGD